MTITVSLSASPVKPAALVVVAATVWSAVVVSGCETVAVAMRAEVVGVLLSCVVVDSDTLMVVEGLVERAVVVVKEGVVE